MSAKRIDTAAELRDLARELGVRKSWHEPDEQDVTAVVHGTDFDNAGFWGNYKGEPMTYGDPPRQELWVEVRLNDEAVAEVNLATLFAFATGYEG